MYVRSYAATAPYRRAVGRGMAGLGSTAGDAFCMSIPTTVGMWFTGCQETYKKVGGDLYEYIQYGNVVTPPKSLPGPVVPSGKGDKADAQANNAAVTKAWRDHIAEMESKGLTYDPALGMTIEQMKAAAKSGVVNILTNEIDWTMVAMAVCVIGGGLWLVAKVRG